MNLRINIRSVYRFIIALFIMAYMPVASVTGVYAAQLTDADADDNVKWYEVEGGWAGFDPSERILTWWPREAEGDIAVPESFDGVPVERIGEWAFYEHDKLTSVTLPASVVSVEEGAFSRCMALTSVVGFNHVKSVGDYAFRYCEKLKTLSTIESLTSVGFDAFEGCSSLKELVKPAAVHYAPAVTSNVSHNIYSDAVVDEGSYFSRKVDSYLYREGDYYWRVEHSGVINIEKYTEDFDFVEGFNLETDLLKIWGGFFCGKEFNFIVYGDKNYEENNKKPVITIDKYSKDWKKLDTLTLKNCNTVEPFRSSAVRFAEYGKYLYIYAGQRMYKAKDGYNHQKNMLLQINENKMKLTDCYDRLDKGYFVGHVSHCFNQYILIDSNKNIITFNHGDKGPRSICLFKNAKKAGKKKFLVYGKGTMLEVYKIPEYKGTEDFGYNMTGTSLGGLEETKDGYVGSYATDEKGGNAEYEGIKNVFLTFTPKSKFTEEATETIKLTSYAKKGTESAGTPQMVSTGTDGGYVLWGIIKDGMISGRIAWVRYDAQGNVSEVNQSDGYLSDCKPICVGNEVLWYTTRNSAPAVYHLTGDGITLSAAGSVG
ncbi:MAG: leucine-rich repeat domain-containing protein [Lachnospiraceae bacterium]|nr:leucine-rich repeat domain-containing protein [Lachnospiraceae bacterium]